MTAAARVARVLLAAALALPAVPLAAHDGPPFPIVSDAVTGPYELDVWTDPDATDDGTAGGQFWVMLRPVDRARPLPTDTAVTIRIRPSAADGAWDRARARPIDGEASRQFAVLVMDHEGRFDVRVEIEGGLGSGRTDAWVDATYDLRPPPAMLVVYLLPFLAVGALWMKLLIKRRQARAGGVGA